jgi:hypothetical protein
MSDHGAAPEQQVLDLGRQWTDAELRGDADALAQLLATISSSSVPLEFVLDKAQYLGSRRSAT